MFFIKNKIILIISLISFTLIILGIRSFRWQPFDESLISNRTLTDVLVSPLFWAWPGADEDPVVNSFGEFFITETHQSYGDPAIPLIIDAKQTENLQTLLQSIRIRPTTKMLSRDNPPEIPFSITFFFVNPEHQHTDNPDHVHITFYGSRILGITKRSHQSEGTEGKFEIHPNYKTIFYDILELLNSEALKLLADTRD